MKKTGARRQRAWAKRPTSSRPPQSSDDGMDVAEAYQKQIVKEKKEDYEYLKMREEERRHHQIIKPDFSDYCRQIAISTARKLFKKVYKARQDAGLPPFTHVYDYPLHHQCWLANRDFSCRGRYGSDSDDVVFVPEGISVKGTDHTMVIYVDDWKRNRLVPAYSNTV